MSLSLVAFIGPSAVGKSSTAKKLNLKPFVTLTTRKPRRGEVDGEDYHFISVEEFLERRKGGYLIEDIEYAGNYYGTDRRDLERVLNSGEPHYVVVTYDGYEQLCQHVPKDSIISIFLWAPQDHIVRRLNERGDDAKTIQKRLELYNEQMSYGPYCDYVVPCFDYYQYITLKRIQEILEKHGITC